MCLSINYYYLFFFFFLSFRFRSSTLKRCKFSSWPRKLKEFWSNSTLSAAASKWFWLRITYEGTYSRVNPFATISASREQNYLQWLLLKSTCSDRYSFSFRGPEKKTLYVDLLQSRFDRSCESLFDVCFDITVVTVRRLELMCSQQDWELIKLNSTGISEWISMDENGWMQKRTVDNQWTYLNTKKNFIIFIII